MTEEIDIPVYHGGWIEVFWSIDSKLHTSSDESSLTFSANLQAFKAMAKQLIYFACNNTLTRAHIHYDMFSNGKGFSGNPLTIEFLSDSRVAGNDLYDDDSMTVVIELPQHRDSVDFLSCPGNLRISCQDATITGDEKAFLYLAKQMLSFNATSGANVRKTLKIWSNQSKNMQRIALILQLQA